jgi:hypothetical protein
MALPDSWQAQQHILLQQRQLRNGLPHTSEPAARQQKQHQGQQPTLRQHTAACSIRQPGLCSASAPLLLQLLYPGHTRQRFAQQKTLLPRIAAEALMLPACCRLHCCLQQLLLYEDSCVQSHECLPALSCCLCPPAVSYPCSPGNLLQLLYQWVALQEGNLHNAWPRNTAAKARGK